MKITGKFLEMFHVKHNEYDVVFKILLEVISIKKTVPSYAASYNIMQSKIHSGIHLSGKNLNEVFNQTILNSELNISKVKDLSYGVMRNYFSLKTILEKLVKNKPAPEIEILLLIAIYEIKYSKKPDYAITNDIVELSFKLIKNIKIKNFVNAVIRNYLRQQTELENMLITNQEYKYNLPLWIINKFKKNYPDKWEKIIQNSNIKPKISLRVNSKKISIADYIKYLDKENINYKLINNIIILDNTVPVNKIPLFNDGYVSIQDINAQKLVEVIRFNDNEYVLDACSAPGGKACQILENNNVNLIALDIDKNRLAKVEQNFTRLNLKASTICADASNLLWWDKNKFDKIIADVPCSATGTLKRNPDIKLHRQVTDIKNFVNLQRDIVLNLWQCLKNNGYLVYITCSIFKEENQDNISYFKQELANIEIVNELQLLPDENGDGFYYCVLKKVVT